MIKSNHGECFVEGKGGEVPLELNHIFHTILTDNPELLIAVTTAWSDAMEKAIVNTDETLLKCLYKVSSGLAKHFEVEE